MTAGDIPTGHRPKRWYERRPMLSTSVHILEALPDDIVVSVTSGILRLIEPRINSTQGTGALKSIGQDKVQALHKSRQKLRRYDQIPSYHQAMNYLMILPDHEQDEVAKQVFEVSSMVYEYLKLCQQYGQKPSKNDIDSISEIYVASGIESAQEYLDAVEASMGKHTGVLEPCAE